MPLNGGPSSAERGSDLPRVQHSGVRLHGAQRVPARSLPAEVLHPDHAHRRHGCGERRPAGDENQGAKLRRQQHDAEAQRHQAHDAEAREDGRGPADRRERQHRVNRPEQPGKASRLCA